MSLIRIDSGTKVKRGKPEVGRVIGSTVGSVFGPVGSAIGSRVGEVLFGPTQLRPAPSIEVDTDTGNVSILDSSGAALTNRNPLEAVLGEVWAGTRPASVVGKRWRSSAELLRAEGEAYRATPKPPATEVPEPSWSQYDMASSIIPPGGMAGFNQMTSASKLALFPRRSGGSKKRKKRSAAPKRKSTRKRTTGAKRAKRSTGKAAKFVKGSAAAKRYMAKLRKMRK